MVKDFLPISKKDMKKRGWEQCDFVYVIGDAYVDHSSFGPAIISRLLEAFGYKVGIIAQPDWKDKNSIAVLGAPRLGFLVSAGNMDSMVNHYTVSKKHRKTDSFSPGGVMGRRPDYATVVYCNLIRQTFKKEPIIIAMLCYEHGMLSRTQPRADSAATCLAHLGLRCFFVAQPTRG